MAAVVVTQDSIIIDRNELPIMAGMMSILGDKLAELESDPTSAPFAPWIKSLQSLQRDIVTALDNAPAREVPSW